MSPKPTGTRPELRLAKRGGLVEALRLLTPLYGGVVSARNSLYELGAMRVHRASVPVISVGNLTTGGTGKTPFVIWLAKQLRALGRNPGVLSRGYGRAEGALQNDEGALLALELPELPQVQQPDRVTGAAALAAEGADLILLDDGFQHRRLARDLDLVLIDTTRPWGLPPAAPGAPPVEALLPRGLLREPLSSLKRADAVILTRCDQSSEATLAEIERAVRQRSADAPIARAVHRPARVVTAEAVHEPAWLEGRSVTLLSGVGHPAAFEETARSLGAEVRAAHVFEDHHVFQRSELEGLCAEGTELLVTAKDAVKLKALGVSCASLEIELELVQGEAPLLGLIEAAAKGAAGD